MGSRLQKEGDNAFSQAVGCAARADRPSQRQREASAEQELVWSERMSLKGSVK